MHRSLAKFVIIAPLAVLTGTAASAAEQSASLSALPGLDVLANPFDLDVRDRDPIRFSRIPHADAPEDVRPLGLDQLTEFSFELKPQKPDFSRSGLYGLGLIGRPSVAISSGLVGHDEARTDLNEGFSYSAGVRVEHEDAVIDGTAYVSSSLLGVSYGRMGRLWYGGIDVNVEQFRDEQGDNTASEVVSLDLTTGRRLGITGLDASSPLWLLSLQGNVDLQEVEDQATEDLRPDWYLNPSLFWQHPGFTFSAEMQVPVAPYLDDETEEPDYRLRAIFEKRFR